MVANNLLEAEATMKHGEREKFLAEKCPPLELPYSKDELTVRQKQDSLTWVGLLSGLLLYVGVTLYDTSVSKNTCRIVFVDPTEH